MNGNTKRLMLATAMLAAISLPAMALDNQNASSTHDRQSKSIQPAGKMQDRPQGSNGLQTQVRSESDTMSKPGSALQADSGQNRAIQPSSLSEEQIREIQMNLNKAGFSAKRLDGVWGDETQAALRNFQHMKSLSGDGKLNTQTLAALGVNVNDQPRAGNDWRDRSEHQTTGAAVNAKPSSSAQPSQSR